MNCIEAIFKLNPNPRRRIPEPFLIVEFFDWDGNLEEVEAILLIGLQASGKSTFYERAFASTHLRISMDIAGTRSREVRLMQRCLDSKTSFVVDDTNSTMQQRHRFIAPAKAAGFKVLGYFFPPDVKSALERNSARTGKARVPVPGIYRTLKFFQPPKLEEGFYELWNVTLNGTEFVVTRHFQSA